MPDAICATPRLPGSSFAGTMLGASNSGALRKCCAMTGFCGSSARACASSASACAVLPAWRAAAACATSADKASRAKFDPPGVVGAWFYARAHDHGLIIRAIGDSICFCPPLIVTKGDVDEIVARFAAVLDEAAAWVNGGMT